MELLETSAKCAAQGVIVVVEDDAPLAELLREVLSKEGFSVLVFQDGAQALAFLSHKPADIVVSDIRMPEVGGFELLEWCRQNYPAIKVVLMTGCVDELEIAKAEEIASGFLMKPFKARELLALIDQLKSV